MRVISVMGNGHVARDLAQSDSAGRIRRLNLLPNVWGNFAATCSFRWWHLAVFPLAHVQVNSYAILAGRQVIADDSD